MTPFLENTIRSIQPLDATAMQAARSRQNELTRPAGSLGRLELAGVILGAAAAHVPVVVDGFISGAAALIAVSLAPAARDYMIAAHRSVEIGHRAILEHLSLQPLLDLDLRLGEGTGAALGISICQAACRVLDEMATFAEAGVSNKER